MKFDTCFSGRKEGSTDQTAIASVFYNRLNQAMPSQSNIAILYAQGKLERKRLLKEDAEIDTDIDSFSMSIKRRAYAWAIDSPSLSALEATIDPSKMDCLLLVAMLNRCCLLRQYL